MNLRPVGEARARSRRPHRILAPVLAASLLQAVPAAGETLREASRKTFDARGVTALEVDNARGRTDVRAGGASQVSVSALKTVRAGHDDTARELADQLVVETEVQSGKLRIRVRYPQHRNIRVNLWEGFSTGDLPRGDVALTVDVPPGLLVSVRSSSGDQATEGLRGTQSLSSSSGDIAVVRSAGAVEIRTSSGDVTVDGSAAPVRVSTSSGDVEVPAASDSLAVETTSGDVEIDEASGGVSVQSSSGEVRVRGAARRVRIGTVSGEIHAALKAPLLGARITSSSGDVTAEIGSGVGCALDLRTSSGSIDLDVPARARTVSRRAVVAVLGDGKAPVELESVSGDLLVTGRYR
jgi:hypothetical protein